MTDTDARGRDAALLRGEALLAALAAKPVARTLAEARALLTTLRNQRAYPALLALAEALARIEPGHAASRCLQAQGLIETGAVTQALAVLGELTRSLPRTDGQWAEAWGLVGRCHKQILFDAARSGAGRSAVARRALALAVDAYGRPYRADRRTNTWHGINLLALALRARREGWEEIAPTLDAVKLARGLMADMQAVPKARRLKDPWYLPTLAEVALGLTLASGETQPVETVLAEYLRAPGLSAFQVNSTLRQFTQVWGLDTLTKATPGIALRGDGDLAWTRRLVDILRARLLQLPGGEFQLPPTAVAAAPAKAQSARAALQTAAPAQVHTQLEALLGAEGPQTFAWWRAGVEAARAVGVVRERLGRRLGSGFLVRAADLGLSVQPDEVLFLTNHHVVNPEGAAPGIKPADAEVVFEAADEPGHAYGVAALLWTSPVAQHDASLLRLQAVPAGVRPLPVCTDLPALPPPPDATGRPPRARVYVIGYPGGRELSFSFQDNELLDHEGPDAGKPQIDGVVRLHYRAPTEGGSSGSPVFEDKRWQVIALHHMGGKFGMPKLNGAGGTYAANEGLAMRTLAAALQAALNPA
ncbi:MAG: serine protease [Rubrivivax sp.]|nr:MAG: serine protease [Rubrivivax sp.]